MKHDLSLKTKWDKNIDLSSQFVHDTGHVFNF